mgnify:FL=1
MKTNLNSSRRRNGKYELIEEELLKFIDYRFNILTRDKTGLSWFALKVAAEDIVQKLLQDEKITSNVAAEFRISDGWLSNVNNLNYYYCYLCNLNSCIQVLKRNHYVGVTLHGVATEVNEVQAENDMNQFRKDGNKLCFKLWQY